MVEIYLKNILRDGNCLHLENHGLISDSQHSFVHGKSCLVKLIGFFKELSNRIKDDKAVGLVHVNSM